MAVVMLVPFLGVLAVQTWSIDSGHATSPPSTVQFPGAYSYYFVQLVILGLAFAAANQVRILRLRRRGSLAGVVNTQREVGIGIAINLVPSIAVVMGFAFANGFFDASTKIHHSASGSPPAIAAVTMLLTILTLAVVGAMNLAARRTARLQDRSVGTVGQPMSHVAG
jgi:hypothetical protein